MTWEAAFLSSRQRHTEIQKTLENIGNSMDENQGLLSEF
jgi:hypothetical protein